MDHGFFLFKFSCEEDCTRVLEDNGHNYGGRPLILQRWDLNTLMEKKKLSEIPIWIKLHGLHLKFYNSHCLSRIASLIGKPLYMDTQTAEASRLNYARLCVLVSAEQLLLDSIKLCTSSGEIIQQIDYDWKPRACSFCMDFSHGSNDCHLQSNQPKSQYKKEWRPKINPPMEADAGLLANPDPPPIVQQLDGHKGNLIIHPSSFSAPASLSQIHPNRLAALEHHDDNSPVNEKGKQLLVHRSSSINESGRGLTKPQLKKSK
ncbi:uncharacterized protein LOC143892060 [Tasmannia lanceolata]|uniref:uncharacterized protein LOC143892060 n=1 Tax=Tasmannia lanceolata TaxID=3420 RepID=UPI0040638F52